MKNRISVKDLKSFMKRSTKLITLTIIITVAFVIALFGYNYYTESTMEEFDESALYLNQDEIVEILEQEPEDITNEEFEDAQESLVYNSVEFTFAIENEDQSIFTDSGLLKNLLTTDEVVANIEDSANTEIQPGPEFSVDLGSQEGNTGYLRIGTGDVEINQSIAQAYYQLFEEEELPFFQNRNVYLIEEPQVVEPAVEDRIGFNITEFSLSTFILTIIGGAILGFIIGICLAALREWRSVYINEFTILDKNELDTVFPFYEMEGDNEITESRISYLLNYPEKNVKLVLVQPETIAEEQTYYNTAHLADLSNLEPDKKIDEVIMLIKLGKTTKKWYSNQRIQLEKLNKPVSIIMV